MGLQDVGGAGAPSQTSEAASLSAVSQEGISLVTLLLPNDQAKFLLELEMRWEVGLLWSSVYILAQSE